MANFTKIVHLGVGQFGRVFCQISFTDGNLSITGVEGPTRDGNCTGSCGQIVMGLKGHEDTITPAPGWTRDMLTRFFDVWGTWRLNDMIAGSPAQSAHLATLKFPGYPVSHYHWACEQLEAVGLQPDPNCQHKGKPYSYGSAWLRVEVPADVIAFLESLPKTDITPAWV